MNQLNLMFDDYDTPNDCGVYSKCERIALAHVIKGWRGMPLAEIAIANTPSGFIWAISMCFVSCGFSSLPNECMLKHHHAQSRTEAIKQASSEILKHVTASGNYSKEKYISNIVQWANEVAA